MRIVFEICWSFIALCKPTVLKKKKILRMFWKIQQELRIRILWIFGVFKVFVCNNTRFIIVYSLWLVLLVFICQWFSVVYYQLIYYTQHDWHTIQLLLKWQLVDPGASCLQVNYQRESRWAHVNYHCRGARIAMLNSRVIHIHV